MFVCAKSFGARWLMKHGGRDGDGGDGGDACARSCLPRAAELPSLVHQLHSKLMKTTVADILSFSGRLLANRSAPANIGSFAFLVAAVPSSCIQWAQSSGQVGSVL